MNIDDIPLPPVKNNDDNNAKASKSNSQKNKKDMVKLPMAVKIKKVDPVIGSNSKDKRKKSFIATLGDKVQITVACMNEVENGKFVKIVNGSHSNEDRKFNDRKRHQRDSSTRKSDSKKARHSYNHHNCHTNHNTHHRSHSRNRKRDSKNKSNDHQHHRQQTHRNSPIKSRGYHSRNNHNIKHRHRHSPINNHSRNRDSHSRNHSHHKQHHHSTYNRKNNDHSKSISRHKSPRNHTKNHPTPPKIKQPIINTNYTQSKASEKSSTSSSTSSSSSSLPVSKQHTNIPPPPPPPPPLPHVSSAKQISNADAIAKDVTEVATNYLRHLESTLHKMNIVYKNAYSGKMEDKSQEPQPLLPPPPPPSLPLPPPPPPPQPRSHRTRSNSFLYFDQLSSITSHDNSPFDSITNGASIQSKDSGSCDMRNQHRRRPNLCNILSQNSLITPATNTTTHASAIQGTLVYHQCLDTSLLQCRCNIPTPDEWSKSDIRACGRGQSCHLSQLHIQCSLHCLTQSLCCNQQFPLNNTNDHRRTDLFFDTRHSLSWKLRTSKPIYIKDLVLEVGLELQEVSSSDNDNLIFVTSNLVFDMKQDRITSLLSYVTDGDESTANVGIEKWIVNNNVVKLGLFATKFIDKGDEIILNTNQIINLQCYYSCPSITNIINDEACSTALQFLRYLIHEHLEIDKVFEIIHYFTNNTNNNITWISQFVDYGGATLLLVSSLYFLQHYSIYSQKSIQFINQVVQFLITIFDISSISCITTLGLDIRDIAHEIRSTLKLLQSDETNTTDEMRILLDQISLLQRNFNKINQPVNKMELNDRVGVIDYKCNGTIDESISTTTSINNNNISSNLDILHCRLPQYWCSQQCGSNRVFFYHQITGAIQWDMPVYPWESQHEDCHDIYDYNQASLIPITHDEIAQMYVGLNKQYELKQKKLIIKPRDKNPKKHNLEKHKKQQFKNKIMSTIRQFLAPHRQPDCNIGRIESEEDLKYLVNKLSDAILTKELRLLSNHSDWLRVTPLVETKTRSYVKTYMKTRGNVYHRHSINGGNPDATTT